MTPFIDNAQFYASHHRNKLAWYTHLIGVPMIILSLMILIGFIHITIPNFFNVKLSELAVLALLIYYFRQNWLIALILTPVFIFLLWIANLFNYAGPTSFALWSLGILFVLGVIIQLIGHIIEGSKPAISEKFWPSMLSPMFITAECLFMAGWLQKLKNQIYSNAQGIDKREES